MSFSWEDYGGVDAAPAVWDTPNMSGNSSIDLGTGWDTTLQGMAKTALGVWGQQTLMQTSNDGRRYIEGQRYVYSQNGAIAGINGGTLLLIGGAFLLFNLMKG